jgi:hypothetical protein
VREAYLNAKHKNGDFFQGRRLNLRELIQFPLSLRPKLKNQALQAEVPKEQSTPKKSNLHLPLSPSPKTKNRFIHRQPFLDKGGDIIKKGLTGEIANSNQVTTISSQNQSL